MINSETGELTVLLHRVSAGDVSAEAELMDRVYLELKHLAARFLRSERVGHTLQTTALVHEAFVRLSGSARIDFVDRNHFFAVAARMMRRLLVDHGRKHQSQKRGSGKVDALNDQLVVTSQPSIVLQDLSRALDRLAEVAPRQAKIVEMRYFGGMTDEEIAAYLKISSRTVKREWALARATLHAQVGEKPRESLEL